MRHNGDVGFLRRNRTRVPSSASGVHHLVVAAGDATEWDDQEGFSRDWVSRLDGIARTASAHGVARVTVVPFAGVVPGSSEHRIEFGSTTLVADRSRDGRHRIVDAARSFASGTTVTEAMLSKALVGDAGEPDLVVVLGDGGSLPSNLVWELAYAEIVFVDVPFAELSEVHIATAIEEFGTRHRRFGGVDA